jgi:hypothetical protein
VCGGGDRQAGEDKRWQPLHARRTRGGSANL